MFCLGYLGTMSFQGKKETENHFCSDDLPTLTIASDKVNSLYVYIETKNFGFPNSNELFWDIDNN